MSSDDLTVGLDRLRRLDVEAILARLATIVPRGRALVVLIDGRSGSGKSTLATELSDRLGAQLVRLDDIYPGWDGLRHASDTTHSRILVPLAAGEAGRWNRWDWKAVEAAEEYSVDPTLPLVIEGSGALSRANRSQADFGIWLDADPALRKRLALARDGEVYAPHWDRWALQEQCFLDRERPDLLADLRFDR